LNATCEEDMQVQVDLREWIAYSLGPPGPLGLFLDPTPTVDVEQNNSIHDVLDLALATAMRKVGAYHVDLQAIDPFRSTRELWVLGWPAVVEFNGRVVHFIDSIGDLTSTPDTITLTLKPRDDIRAKSDALRRLSERFGDAIGLRSPERNLHVAVVDKILNMLVDVRFAPTIREALNSLELSEDSFDTVIANDTFWLRPDNCSCMEAY